VVIRQNIWIVGEQVAFLGLLDVLFDRQIALAARQLEHLIEQAQKRRVVVLAVPGSFQRAAQPLAGSRQDGLGIAGDIGTEGGAADDHELERLEEHGQVPARQGIAADDRHEDDNRAYDDQHGPPTNPSQTTAPALCGAGVNKDLTSRGRLLRRLFQARRAP